MRAMGGVRAAVRDAGVVGQFEILPALAFGRECDWMVRWRQNREHAMNVWLMVLSVYVAPYNSVDWNGPWKLGVSRLSDRTFQSEPECRNFAIQFIGNMHQAMLAPMRFQCFSVIATLPKGAQR